LAERVNAGLRLLEASGKPEPWQEAKKPFWQKPQVTLVLAVAVIGLGNRTVGRDERQRGQEPCASRNSRPRLPSGPWIPRPARVRFACCRVARAVPTHRPSPSAVAGNAQLADLKIDESRSPYKIFRVTIDRIDQGRVAVISELAKDSNGHSADCAEQLRSGSG
jgi:hypothetical protein